MGKKKKKHQKHHNYNSGVFLMEDVMYKSKKKLNKEFKKALKDIEETRLQMYEADKKSSNRKDKKKINKAEAEFYTNMDSIKCRKNIAKKWEKDGFMDHMVHLLKEVSPFVQLLARALASLITLFLSIPLIKEHISPRMVSSLSTVFDLALAM